MAWRPIGVRVDPLKRIALALALCLALTPAAEAKRGDGKHQRQGVSVKVKAKKKQARARVIGVLHHGLHGVRLGGARLLVAVLVVQPLTTDADA